MNYSMIVMSVFLFSCGTEEPPERTCIVTNTSEGASIRCPDQPAVVVKNGTDGLDGTRGEDGTIGEVEYLGYFCSRVVLRIKKQPYIIYGQLIPIYDTYLKIGNTCKIRYNKKKGEVETK